MACARTLTRQTTWTALDNCPSVQSNQPPNGLRRPLTVQPTLLVGEDGQVLENQRSTGIWSHRGLTRQLTQEISVSSISSSASSAKTVRPVEDLLHAMDALDEKWAGRGLSNWESSLSSHRSATQFQATVRLLSGNTKERQTSYSIFDTPFPLRQLELEGPFYHTFNKFVVVSPPPSIFQTEDNRAMDPGFPGMLFRLQNKELDAYGVSLLECINQCGNLAYLKDSEQSVPDSWLQKSAGSGIIIEITWPGYPDMSWRYYQPIDKTLTRGVLAAEIAKNYSLLISGVWFNEDSAMRGLTQCLCDPSLIGQNSVEF